MYRIKSKAGVDYGPWPGEDEHAAFKAMVESASTYPDPAAGVAEDWIIAEVSPGELEAETF